MANRDIFDYSLSVSYNMTSQVLSAGHAVDRRTKCISIREVVNALVGRWSFDAAAISMKNQRILTEETESDVLIDYR